MGDLIAPVGRRLCAKGRRKCSVQPIENVVVGDYVWTLGEDKKQPVKRRVNRLFRHQDQPILRVLVRTRGVVEVIQATPEHPCWVQGRGWVAAGALKPEDILLRIDGGDPAWVLGVRDDSRTSDVFNFEVADVHNYFVGRVGVLVHNDSSLDVGDGAPLGRPVPAPDPATSPFILIDQLGRPTRDQTVRLASRVAIGASLLMAGNHMVEKYSRAYSDAVVHAAAVEASAVALPSAQYGLAGPLVPQLRVDSDLVPRVPFTFRLTKPDFLVQYEQFRLARDTELVSEPLELRSRTQFADAPAKIVGRGLLGLVPKYETLTSARDFEVVEAKIRQQLRQGNRPEAEGLAHDANIDLARYNELNEEAYVQKRESPYMLAARALLTDGQFQADLADIGGRALTASSYGQVPGLNGVAERGRMAVTAALWIGYGLSESLDIARHGAGGWSGATSHAEAWRKPLWEMAKRGVYNMASEQAGLFLPTARMREVQSLGRWSMQPDSWSSNALRYVGMAGTDTALGALGSQAIRWWAHGVDPSMPAPLADGFLPTIVPDMAANGFGYGLLYPGVTSKMGGGKLPWEYRAVVLIGARALAYETYDQMMSP